MSSINRFAVLRSTKVGEPVPAVTKSATCMSEILADLASSTRIIEAALSASPACCTGLVMTKRAFAIPVGPSGGAEIVALVHADGFAYWYGHVMRHPQRDNTFVALLVWSEKMVNAVSVPLLFRRFHYWIRDRLCYQPCTIQQEDDAYAECSSFKMAAICLAGMVRRFHIDLRWPDEEGAHAKDPTELRILGIYGLEGAMREDGHYPPEPMAIRLVSVGNRVESN